MSDLSSDLFSAETRKSFSAILIHLLKGPLYRSRHRDLWEVLQCDQHKIRSYFQPLGLQVRLDDAEGYAFLIQSSSDTEEEDDMPRLIPRRRLTFSQSVLLVALRKKLAEHDEEGSEPRLIVTRQEVYSWLSAWLPEVTNEVKQRRDMDALIKKVTEMGFLSALPNHADDFEVQRIIKAMVSAEQISAFRLLLAEKCTVTDEGGKADATD
ncbi:DUF4194 domain-containing protein [Lelliottia amnigena]|uniref:DUF4194 domain-containing protein n=1 Tax=Lelliottia amnigena TaxID=61646 RepID=UPI004056D406